MIIAIAAIGKNRELGKGGKLLWHITEDMKRMRELTTGHPIIMGRKTYDSIIALRGKPLPNRTTIVVSRSAKWEREGDFTVSSVEEAIRRAKACPGGDSIFIFGGAEIYAAAMQYVDRLELTFIDATDSQADAYFPVYAHEFTKVAKHIQGCENGIAYHFLTLEKEATKV